MALTAKPISTISYNTEEFITRKLEQMFNAHIITDYRWIKHMGEDGDKDHIHLWMAPNKRIDTALLREEFNEIPKGSPDDKPLGCLPFRGSKDDHWIMYVLHDPDYLRAHHSDDDGDGKIPYELNEIKTPFPEQLARDYKKALALRKTKNQEVIDRIINQHQSISQIMYETPINPTHILAINQALIIDQSRREIEAQQEIKRLEMKQIKEAAKITGSVEVVDQMPQNKAEYEKQILPERVERFHLNMATGELVSDGVEIRHIKEEEDDHGLWEGLEYDKRRQEHKNKK